MTPVKKTLTVSVYLFFAAALGLVLGFFELVQRVSWCFSRRVHERSVCALNKGLWFCLKILGTRKEVESRGELPKSGQVIFVSNHQSMFDIVLLAVILAEYRPRFIAKKELARGIPSVSFNLRYGGNIIIDRENPKSAVETLRNSVRNLCADGASIVIFPEGTRSKTGELNKFKTAGSVLLFEELSQAPVIPVTLDNTRLLSLRKKDPGPLGVSVKVIVGPPLERIADEPQQKVLERAKARIQAHLEEMRSGKSRD